MRTARRASATPCLFFFTFLARTPLSTRTVFPLYWLHSSPLHMSLHTPNFRTHPSHGARPCTWEYLSLGAIVAANHLQVLQVGAGRDPRGAREVPGPAGRRLRRVLGPKEAGSGGEVFVHGSGGGGWDRLVVVVERRGGVGGRETGTAGTGGQVYHLLEREGHGPARQVGLLQRRLLPGERKQARAE